MFVLCLCRVQVCRPVAWETGVRAMLADGHTQLYELGPQRQLKVCGRCKFSMEFSTQHDVSFQRRCCGKSMLQRLSTVSMSQFRLEAGAISISMIGLDTSVSSKISRLNIFITSLLHCLAKYKTQTSNTLVLHPTRFSSSFLCSS